MRTVARILLKDLRLGPRSPILLWAIALPIIFTFLIGAVFGDLFAPPPRLAVVDDGSSQVTVALEANPGIETTVLDDAEQMRADVEAHDYDAGLLLPAGLDDDLAADRPATIAFVVSGQSLASTRLVLGVTTLDELRSAGGEADLVEVTVSTVGDEEWVPVDDRVLPLIVIYAVMIAGLFLPASSLVQERESRTIDAVLVTPARMSQVLLAKGALGVLLAVLMGWVTLALNGALTGQVVGLTVFLVLGGVMMAELGLILGSWAKDSNTLFSAVKGGGVLVIAPVLFTLFPGLPQGVARIFPTYYFLQPIYDMSVFGTSITDHWLELVVCTAICVLMLPLVASMGRRLEQQLAATV